MIQDDNKKAELFNDYFCKQADLDDSETSVPDITDQWSLKNYCYRKRSGRYIEDT